MDDALTNTYQAAYPYRQENGSKQCDDAHGLDGCFGCLGRWICQPLEYQDVRKLGLDLEVALRTTLGAIKESIFPASLTRWLDLLVNI